MTSIIISGHTVEYYEHSGIWCWRDEDGKEIFKDSQLRPVREAIERHEAKLARQVKEKFEPWKAVIRGGWAELKRIEVISEEDMGSVWVRDVNKRRTKERLSNILRLDATIEAALAEYEALQSEIDARSTRRTEIVKLLFPKQ